MEQLYMEQLGFSCDFWFLSGFYFHIVVYFKPMWLRKKL